MSKGAKKYLFDWYGAAVSLIRLENQKLLFHPSCALILAFFLAVSYGIKCSFFFFFLFTGLIQCFAECATLMEFALKANSNHHVRPARLLLTAAELTLTPEGTPLV